MDSVIERLVGRPTKYDPDLIPAMLEAFYEGMSKHEVAVTVLGVHIDTMYEWEKVHPEFSEALKKGVELSRAWWEKRGRTSLNDETFSATLWYMNMKNRFKWTDRQEVSGDPERPVEHNHRVDAMGLEELKSAFARAKGTD